MCGILKVRELVRQMNQLEYKMQCAFEDMDEVAYSRYHRQYVEASLEKQRLKNSVMTRMMSDHFLKRSASCTF